MLLTLRSMMRDATAFGAAMLLAGCIASQPGALPSQAAGAMAGALQQHDLLYVANGNGTVSVYRYWQHTLAFVLTDFKQPMGVCADRNGHVYITDYQREKIYEYAHGGKKPIATLDDSPYAPYTCSVSPSNGDLAVANSPYSTYAKGGNIAIYPHGGGKPVILYAGGGPTNGVHFTACAYDDHGDLLAMNEYHYSPFWYFAFYYLAKNGTNLLPMSLPDMGYSTHSGVVEGIAWDGKYWVVGPLYNELFQYTIDVKASEVGRVKLDYGRLPFIGPVAIYRKTLKSQGTQLAGGTGESSDALVDFFKYPAGGDPIAQISKDLAAPFGVAISLRTEP